MAVIFIWLFYFLILILFSSVYDFTKLSARWLLYSCVFWVAVAVLSFKFIVKSIWSFKKMNITAPKTSL